MSDRTMFIAIAACVPAAFALGYAFATGADWAMLRYWRGKANRNEDALNDLIGSCRKVLSDAWFNRVMRNWHWCYGGGKKGGAE